MSIVVENVVPSKICCYFCCAELERFIPESWFQGILNDGNLSIQAGAKIGLIGRNGIGKSTLVNYLSTLLQENDSPWICVTVDQSVSTRLESMSLVDYMLQETDLEDDPSAESQAKKILNGLGFLHKQFDTDATCLSGGWRSRLALAKALFSIRPTSGSKTPRLLILDEPTNHLDLSGILWLLQYCVNSKHSLLIISHNTYFMNNVCDCIWEMTDKKLEIFKTTFGGFMDEKEKRLRQVKKSKKKVSLVGKPRPMKLSTQFLGGDGLLLSLQDSTLGYDEPILEDVNFGVYNETRICILGDNGSGKSTLLKSLTGDLPLLNGYKYQESGLRISTFNQHFHEEFIATETAVDFMLRHTQGKLELARKYLGTVGLVGEFHTRPIETLSGGQKVRVYLAYLSSQQPHILILDEPTNHLDVFAVDELVKALEEQQVTLIIVSHDLDFVQKFAPEVWLCQNKQLVSIGDSNTAINKYVKETLKKYE